MLGGAVQREMSDRRMHLPREQSSQLVVRIGRRFAPPRGAKIKI